jgi:hypothetical protein
MNPRYKQLVHAYPVVVPSMSMRYRVLKAPFGTLERAPLKIHPTMRVPKGWSIIDTSTDSKSAWDVEIEID